MEIDKIILFLNSSCPRMIWEMDRETLGDLRRRKDCQGEFLWAPSPNYTRKPGTILGIEVSIAEDKCFQLRYEFPDGHSHVIKMDGI